MAGRTSSITGRCADSALALGILMHEFGWAADDYDRLGAGSLVGSYPGMRTAGNRRHLHRLGHRTGLGTISAIRSPSAPMTAPSSSRSRTVRGG